MNNKQQSFTRIPNYLIAVFVASTYKQNLSIGPKTELFPSIIATTYYLNDEINLDLSNNEHYQRFCKNLDSKTYYRKKGSQILPKKRILIEVIPTFDNSIIPTNSSLVLPLEISASRNNNNNNNNNDYPEEELDIQQVFNKIETGVNLTYSVITETNFFSDNFIQKYLLNKKISLIDHVFIFHKKNWKYLVQQFKEKKLIISGGSGVHRHSFSPIQLEIARFIIDLESFLYTNNNKLQTKELIKTSFKITKNLHSLNIITIFIQREDVWLVREKIRFLGLLDDCSKEILFWIGIFKFTQQFPNTITYLLTIFSLNLTAKDNQDKKKSLLIIIKNIINKGLDLKERDPYLQMSDSSNNLKDLNLYSIVESLIKKNFIINKKVIYKNDEELNKRILELYENTNIKTGKLKQFAKHLE